MLKKKAAKKYANKDERLFTSPEKFVKRGLGFIRRRKVQRTIKDRLFRFLFEKDREALLQLYNALNGTDYRDASSLQVMTIENAVYVSMKNDIAFVIAGTLNMYEHQSTYNPNMPVRMLIYLAVEYEKLIEQTEVSLYGAKKLMLPTPQCVVFYNGEKEIPEEQVMFLSDLYENKERKADLELRVRLLNINHGHNTELMNKCRVLDEYAKFVDIARAYIAEGSERNEALSMAIDYCIDHNILSEFLRKYRAEVLGMLLEEFDVKKYEKSLKEEGREEISRLTIFLLEQNRIDDLRRAAVDRDYRNELLKELGDY
ncbi:MAG: hypothetical protein NC433_00290 [Clostridiales bacterium]|nr:hypothetical protein [Clostridiales bacterium]